jgi:hypothetical protein
MDVIIFLNWALELKVNKRAKDYSGSPSSPFKSPQHFYLKSSKICCFIITF